MNISVTDPISPAISRAKFITFQPFSIGKWFALGFVAWLATLGQNGANFNIPGGGGGRGPAPAPIPAPVPGRRFPRPTATPPEPFDEAWAWVTSHIPLAIGIGLGVVLLIVALSLLVLWINSRAQFMFIENIANNTHKVVEPWKRWRAHGNSLFKFRVVLIAIGLGIAIAVSGIGFALAWSDIQARTFDRGAITAIIVMALLLLPAIVILSIVNWLLQSFVTVIMYATGATAAPAWAEFRQNVMRGNGWKLFLFLLMHALLSIVVMVGRLILGCVTCCIGFIPYLSSVIALPLIIFLRAYPIYFLQQFDPRYVVIVEAPPTPMAMGFPMYPQNPQQPPPPPMT